MLSGPSWPPSPALHGVRWALATRRNSDGSKMEPMCFKHRKPYKCS